MVLLQSPSNGGTQSSHPESLTFANGETMDDDDHRLSEDLYDSTCSTPYVSAPSSPGRGPTTGYFFSAPASPMHFMLSSAPSASYTYSSSSETVFSDSSSFEFDFSSRLPSNNSLAIGSMSSADELFMNGQIRPMKLSSHLQRPQILAPLLDLDVEEEEDDEAELEKRQGSMNRGRDLKLRSRSLHRKARSLSPLRNADLQWLEQVDCSTSEAKAKETEDHILELRELEAKRSEAVSSETTPSCSTSSSRSSSSGRNSKKWIFLKEILYRSKSEGRGNAKEKFWSSISFSPSKEKEKAPPPQAASESQKKNKKKQSKQATARKGVSGKPTNGVAKRKVPQSPHELHYTANRAQAEELKKRTFLPYRQGLLGCLGFNSKGYGALSGLTRALNPVSSR
ncbi:hypothetical protein FNV43_RR23611 [Rhamnella rubrinervis]|uniref:Uncharacterized protein n=1 Tax=Rhamnella rubrinervis TaxID=2594499 RepID=A0A8K0DYV3_9ROSA|nr:hypothetical protein FNV43_RR23611 [Rhamnella rubrinervis]